MVIIILTSRTALMSIPSCVIMCSIVAISSIPMALYSFHCSSYISDNR